MKVVLTGGGTGGHIYPCLAVSEILSQEDIELFYIGTKGKLEEELIKERHPHIEFLPVVTAALPIARKHLKNPFTWIFKMIKWVWDFNIATRDSIRYLRDKKIDVVFGTGGYAAAPAFAAAILTKTPYIIHNLDAHIGLANKMFIRDAAALTLAFPIDTVAPSNGNVTIAGNPVAQKFFNKSYDSDKNFDDSQRGINLLITGGSQGAESINSLIAEILPELNQRSKLSITHITGRKLYDQYILESLNGAKNKYPNYIVEAYSHEMPKLCKEADIAICRSGAMTIAEMAASGTIPIFIPLPWAAHDHQRKNAQSLADAGAAIVLEQKNLSREVLLNKIYELISDEQKLNEMKENLKQFANPDTARNLARLITKTGSNPDRRDSSS